MSIRFTYQFLFICFIALTNPIVSLYSQSSANLISLQKKLLLRDSLDYKYKSLPINTKSNEFSPIPYNGGLLYISDKPIPSEKIVYNKIYWTKDTGFKINDNFIIKINSKDTTIKYLKLGKTDDFTAPTSNDNDILTRYKRKNIYSNSIELSFSNFSTDQAFTFNDSLNLIVYAKKSNYTKDGIRHWSLWQANLVNGKLKHKKKILFEDKNADYLYPFINLDATKLYLSSNIKNGKGGYDIYYVNIKNGVVGVNLIPLDEINSQKDEIAPSISNDTLFFSSNRDGGLGGFDAYYKLMKSEQVAQNIGYPVNTENDEISLKKVYNEYYLTSNRLGNFDIFSIQYLPIIYNFTGILNYKNDGSLAANHLMYLKDKDTDVIIDSIVTDNFAKFSFRGKPNRNYEFTFLNADSLYEKFTIPINAKQTQYDFISYIKGRSPKQKADSLNALWVMQENKRLDSLSKFSLQTKFVVHYAFNKSVISNNEKLVLDSLIKKLQSMPKVYISIGAFTDCIGSYKYNYRLSVKRGQAVVNYLTKNGLDKKRIIANGYSKKYNITPCFTKYTKNTKSLQQDNRRAEIVLSENKNSDWATLEKERGSNFYNVYNASKLNNKNILSQQLLLDSINAVQLYLAKQKVLELENTRNIQDSINKAKIIAALNLKKEQALQIKIEKAKQDSINKAKAISLLILQKAKQDSIKAVQLYLAKQKAIELENTRKIQDSINKAKAIAALNLKKEQALQIKIEKAKQDSIKAIQLYLAKQKAIELERSEEHTSELQSH